ncbi:hypothetical protein ASZ90_010384 [hydrocarbon metagenome]|uniref:Methanogenesis marker protein 8 n=1 Tax=hydrocarbon metagenome TaxID=938273 RepID=A0A0W8FG87_9ZZZZ|nr:DUF2099 family protein [Methanomicrobiaceae archaeon]
MPRSIGKVVGQMQDEHIIEAIGRCRVVIRNGSVIEVGEPVLDRCPLAERFACPVNEITKEAVRANIEHRISSFGMCTKDRDVLSARDFVVFGASELLSGGIRRGLIDSAVTVCDGAGTVVTDNPLLVQGIGGRMSGLVRTTPIPEVIERIRQHGGHVLDPETAAIDQAAGVALASSLGYRRIAATTARPDEALAIRARHPETLIVGVHITGLTGSEAEQLVSVADLVTACASRTVREAAGRVALLQAGISIPVFAVTPPGREIILAKLGETGQQMLVHGARLPIEGGRAPHPLV